MSGASDAARVILRAKLGTGIIPGATVTADSLVIELNNAGVFVPDPPSLPGMMPAWPITTDTGRGG